jgi:flagellar biosynthesis GTPase FlhF
LEHRSIVEMAARPHVICFLVTPNLNVEPQPKRRLWKMAHDLNLAIKVQRLNDQELTRLAIRGPFAKGREFAANLQHFATREPQRFAAVTEVHTNPDPASDYQVHFNADRFDVFDDAVGRIYPTPPTANSRPGSSGGAGAPPQPSVYDTDTVGSASASTIRRQLEIAQEAVDDANDAASASAMEAARLRNEAAAAAGREAAERRAREAAEAQAAQEVAARQAAETQAAQEAAAREEEHRARQAAEAQVAQALAEVQRLRALLAARA